MRVAAIGRWPSWLAVATLLAACAWLLVRLEPGETAARALPSFDIYSYFYPVMIYAADAVRHGGKGLLWNAMQDCGQPFLGSGTTGVLYPAFLFSLVFDADTALRAVLFFNAAVGAVGTYLLCRVIGVGRVAAVCGGIAFTCSNAAVDLITSTTILGGPYAWMPVAMLCCERLLRMPGLASSAALGVVLTLRTAGAILMAAAIVLNVLALRPPPLRTLLPAGTFTLRSNVAAFPELRSLVTPQDRVHIAGKLGDHALQQKTGSLFGVPALNDYDSLASLQFANYFTALRLGGKMHDLQVFYFVLGGMLPPTLKRSLLDLAAVRYVVVDETEDANAAAIRRPPLKLVFHHTRRPLQAAGSVPPTTPAPGKPDFVRIYENTTAMARARWVSKLAVVRMRVSCSSV